MATTKAEKDKAAKSKAARLAALTGVPQSEAAHAPVANLPAGFSTERRVTMPSLSLKDEGIMYLLKFEDAFRESTVQGKALLDAKGKPTGEFEKPATVCGVTDVQTGEVFTLLGPTVVIKNLDEHYPGGEYVGKIFAITNRGKSKSGQRYVNFDIAEVEKG